MKSNFQSPRKTDFFLNFDFEKKAVFYKNTSWTFSRSYNEIPVVFVIP